MTDRQITERMIYEANIRVAKAQLWNEAVGKLRALYNVQRRAPNRMDFSPSFVAVRNAVENFILEFENEGLDE